MKSLLIGLAVSLVYALIIQLTRPDVPFSQNQYQANMIFAQEFIYLEEKPSQVIVGSSMATRMMFEGQDDIYNLAFGGGGPLTGLEIIRRSGYLPKTIYIESNVFTMKVDKAFIDALFTPVLFELRSKIVALQEKYQLLNLVGSLLYTYAGRSKKELLEQKVDVKLLDKLVETALVSRNKLVINEEEAFLNTWKNEIQYFIEHGTQIVFFEMPIDPRLAASQQQKQLRYLIASTFPGVDYILQDNLDGLYETSDGLHLTLRSAEAFTERFKHVIMYSSVDR